MDIKIRIEGITPLLCHRFSDEAARKATSGVTDGIRTNPDDPRVIADGYLWKDEHGNPVIPGPNMFRNIIDAGIFIKTGRSKLTTGKSSLVPAAVMFHEMLLPIESRHDWSVDTRPVRNPVTGGRFNCHRPRFDDWRLEFNVTLDESIIAYATFRELVDKAGTHIGLGSFRPANKGTFGRWKVIDWDVAEPSSA